MAVLAQNNTFVNLVFNRLTFKISLSIAMMIWLASDSRYFTLWLVRVWGIIAIIGLFVNDKTPSGQSTLNLPPSLQFILSVVLIMAAFMATNWHMLGQRDIIQAGYVLFTLILYRDGFYWCLRVSRNSFRSFYQ